VWPLDISLNKKKTILKIFIASSQCVVFDFELKDDHRSHAHLYKERERERESASIFSSQS
jgi:hypothetical protein